MAMFRMRSLSHLGERLSAIAYVRTARTDHHPVMIIAAGLEQVPIAAGRRRKSERSDKQE
jgi:hypothetical protein